MLRAALTFFILGILFMLFGAYGVAGVSIGLGKILLTVFVVLALISFIISITTGKKTHLP